MSTFLEMSNEVVNIIGLQGTLSSVTSPKGIQRNIVDAVSSAWVDIQTLREDFTFMQGQISDFETTQDQVIYTPQQVFGSLTAAANLSVYKTKRGIFYENVALAYVPWEDLPFLANEEQYQPRWYSIDPSCNNLHFQRPDGTYNLIIRYKKAPQVLEAGTDEPFIPEQFHKAIVYKAVARVAAYLGNNALYLMYSQEGDKVIGQLLRHYIRPRSVSPRNFLL